MKEQPASNDLKSVSVSTVTMEMGIGMGMGNRTQSGNLQVTTSILVGTRPYCLAIACAGLCFRFVSPRVRCFHQPLLDRDSVESMSVFHGAFRSSQHRQNWFVAVG